MSVLYETKDGFIIEELLGRVGYYKDILEKAVFRYGLSDEPNYEEIREIGKRINDFMRTSEFDNALGYPTYPRTDYMYDIRRVAESLITVNEKQLKTKEASTKFFREILDKLEDAEMSYRWDSLTR